jgi:hypothetical protein
MHAAERLQSLRIDKLYIAAPPRGKDDVRRVLRLKWRRTDKSEQTESQEATFHTAPAFDHYDATIVTLLPGERATVVRGSAAALTVPVARTA